MEIYLIRHGKTAGNLEHRYVGRTDEDLLPESAAGLQKIRNRLLPVERVYTSRKKRCMQTAAILFPGTDCRAEDGLQEMDFGELEYRNFEELGAHPSYQAWLNSGGKTAFPAAESQEAFSRRCRETFRNCAEEAAGDGCERVAFVVHGGTIMAVMEAFALKKKNYYDWQVKNGEGFLAVWTENGGRPYLDRIQYV